MRQNCRRIHRHLCRSIPRSRLGIDLHWFRTRYLRIRRGRYPPIVSHRQDMHR